MLDGRTQSIQKRSVWRTEAALFDFCSVFTLPAQRRLSSAGTHHPHLPPPHRHITVALPITDLALQSSQHRRRQSAPSLSPPRPAFEPERPLEVPDRGCGERPEEHWPSK